MGVLFFVGTTGGGVGFLILSLLVLLRIFWFLRVAFLGPFVSISVRDGLDLSLIWMIKIRLINAPLALVIATTEMGRSSV
jgi:hypothetical protein